MSTYLYLSSSLYSSLFDQMKNDRRCSSNGCELYRLKLPNSFSISTPSPSCITAFFFGTACIEPHLVQIPAQPYMLPTHPFKLRLDWFIGDRHDLTMRLESCTQVLRFVSQGRVQFYTIISPQTSTKLNLLLTTKSCNDVGGWYGNSLVFAHQPLVFRGDLNNVHPCLLRHIGADKIEDVYFHIRW